MKKTFLGIELGSTRIKAVLIDETYSPIATGSFTWENDLADGVWTYPLEKAVSGVRACYRELRRDFESKFGTPLTAVSAIGNLLTQAMALGDIKDLEHLRQVVRNSEAVETWTPNHTADWENAYQKLLSFLK